MAPDVVIARRNKCDIESLLKPFLPQSRLFNISEKQQWDFQKQFLGYKVSFAELRFIFQYAKNFKNRYKRLRHLIVSKSGLGLSTGVFSVLYAAVENPESQIIISGIGLKGGGHFNGIGHFGKERANVDYYLFLKFPKDIKDRLYTTDKELSINGKIKFWDDALYYN